LVRIPPETFSKGHSGSEKRWRKIDREPGREQAFQTPCSPDEWKKAVTMGRFSATSIDVFLEKEKSGVLLFFDSQEGIITAGRLLRGLGNSC
jgi:hypothetical protein